MKKKKIKRKIRFFTLLSILLITIMIFKQINTDTYLLASINNNNERALTYDNNTLQIENIFDNNYINLSDEEINSLENITYAEKLSYLYNDLYSLETRLKIFLNSYIDNVGLIYYNFDTHEKISLNENENFIAASTYKLGLNVVYYYLESINQIDLNDEITYIYEDYEEGTGILQTYDYIGAIKISDLLDYSLIYSDNIATNMLGRYIGGHPSVREQLYDILDISYDYTENFITPEIEFTILSYVYNNLNDFSHMISVLTETEFHDRLDRYLPTDIVAHKVGSYDEYIHDVGIIFDESPYILIIYTKDLNDAEEIIGQVSKAIYYYNRESR